MRKELYASHITDKTIELTPVFQRTQEQVRTKPLLENEIQDLDRMGQIV